MTPQHRNTVTHKDKNPASALIGLAAVGVGARNLLCISVEKRKPSYCQVFQKIAPEANTA